MTFCSSSDADDDDQEHDLGNDDDNDDNDNDDHLDGEGDIDDDDFCAIALLGGLVRSSTPWRKRWINLFDVNFTSNDASASVSLSFLHGRLSFHLRQWPGTNRRRVSGQSYGGYGEKKTIWSDHRT